MATEKIITAIGVSDEDVAHIRLLMRKDAGELTHDWRWGADSQADLLIVDASNFAGQMARSRAKVTGMRVALVCDNGEDTLGDPAIVRPFKHANIVDVLNFAAGGSENLASSIRPSDDYFQSQMRDSEPDSELDDLLATESISPHQPFDADVALGLEDLFRDSPIANPDLQAAEQTFNPDADVEGTGEQTRRGAARADREREASAVPMNATPAVRTPVRKQNIEDHSVHRLREFLDGQLISGPVQIAWKGAGVLTLDPKNRVFHNSENLRQIETYCHEPVRRSDWRILTTSELSAIRHSQEAQPYAKLVWLDVLLHSKGRLASNLDPGGTFGLTRWLEMARDYPNYARISGALMHPSRLHEVVAASGCEMSMVFDVVSAYDAIGWLKWTPRPSRHANESDSKRSFFDRLRNPFGKS